MELSTGRHNILLSSPVRALSLVLVSLRVIPVTVSIYELNPPVAPVAEHTAPIDESMYVRH